MKLSTGDESTLASYRKLSVAFFGKDSKATKFLDKKIAEHEKGGEELVLADERQMVHMLMQLHLGNGKENP